MLLLYLSWYNSVKNCSEYFNFSDAHFKVYASAVGHQAFSTLDRHLPSERSRAPWCAWFHNFRNFTYVGSNSDPKEQNKSSCTLATAATSAILRFSVKLFMFIIPSSGLSCGLEIGFCSCQFKIRSFACN